MSTFQVYVEEPVITYRKRVILETDDWLDAEAAVIDIDRSHPNERRRQSPSIEGVHPTHDFGMFGTDTQCTRCGSYNNGSYGSHAPCGFDFEGKSLLHHVVQWRQEKAEEVAKRSRYCKTCDFYTDHVSTAHDGLAERGLLQPKADRSEGIS